MLGVPSAAAAAAQTRRQLNDRPATISIVTQLLPGLILSVRREDRQPATCGMMTRRSSRSADVNDDASIRHWRLTGMPGMGWRPSNTVDPRAVMGCLCSATIVWGWEMRSQRLQGGAAFALISPPPPPSPSPSPSPPPHPAFRN